MQVPVLDEARITLYSAGRMEMPSVLHYDDRHSYSSYSLLNRWLLNSKYVTDRLLTNGYLSIEERNKLIKEKKAVYELEVAKEQNAIRNGNQVQSVDELASLLKSAVTKEAAHLNLDVSLGGESSTLPPPVIPKNPICLGFILPSSTSPRTQTIYMNLLNSMFLLRSTVRGVLFDKEGQYASICQLNQFVCVNNYEYRFLPHSHADWNPRPNSPFFPLC